MPRPAPRRGGRRVRSPGRQDWVDPGHEAVREDEDEETGAHHREPQQSTRRLWHRWPMAHGCPERCSGSHRNPNEVADFGRAELRRSDTAIPTNTTNGIRSDGTASSRAQLAAAATASQTSGRCATTNPATTVSNPVSAIAMRWRRSRSAGRVRIILSPVSCFPSPQGRSHRRPVASATRRSARRGRLRTVIATPHSGPRSRTFRLPYQSAVCRRPHRK